MLDCWRAELVAVAVVVGTVAVVVRTVGKDSADVEVVVGAVQLKPRRDTSAVVAPVSETLMAGQRQLGLTT